MPSKAIKGKGITYTITVDETDTVIAELVDLPTPPSPTYDEEEVTHHASTGDAKEFMPTLSDSGEVTFQIHWVPGDAEDIALQAMRGVTGTHTIAWPNDYEWAVDGWVKDIVPASPINGKLTANVIVRTTGPITMQSGS